MTTAPLFQPKGGVLIATSDAGFRDWITPQFTNQCDVELASGGADALAKLETSECSLLILDRNLPDLNAEELRNLAAKDYPGVEIAILDSVSENPLRGLKKGCVSTRRPLIPSGYGGRISQPTVPFEPLPAMLGTTPPMQRLARLVRLVAPRNTPVLISGPTGSGKELVARAVHDLSPRADRPFVVINCAAIPESLLESELFGYARGAFTGAVQSRVGRIHTAQGGTLFLDEIGELPMGLQAKLLRFLEYGEVQRLGSSDVFKVDVRVVAATNANLEAKVASGDFRQDLYFRLAVFPIAVPALCQRVGDIIPMAREFVRRYSGENGVELAGEAQRLLEAHSWPGNVRELMHVIERALILAQGAQRIEAQDLCFSAEELVAS
ncbi:MAG TPA: sigma-54 dependent transcriptional regulator [Terriglobales bacterium]|nr:sigma-54 dependent transcriptional regulator [Terriglobales bacterium]